MSQLASGASTTVNQTADAASNANRITVNDWLRTTNISNLGGIIEMADQLESYRNSGLWPVNGQANYFTSDGLHASQNGYLRVSTMSVVRQALGI